MGVESLRDSGLKLANDLAIDYKLYVGVDIFLYNYTRLLILFFCSYVIKFN